MTAAPGITPPALSFTTPEMEPPPWAWTSVPARTAHTAASIRRETLRNIKNPPPLHELPLASKYAQRVLRSSIHHTKLRVNWSAAVLDLVLRISGSARTRRRRGSIGFRAQGVANISPQPRKLVESGRRRLSEGHLRRMGGDRPSPAVWIAQAPVVPVAGFGCQS